MISSSSTHQDRGKEAKGDGKDERGILKREVGGRKKAFAQSVPIFRISFKLALTESHQLLKDVM